VVTLVFAGVFGKNGRFYVVFWWCDRGGLRGGRGVLAVTFWGSKNAPRFGDLFWRVSRFGTSLTVVRGSRSLTEKFCNQMGQASVPLSG
jgi:hypothetical protein